ncbi:MAG: hypothetical protein LBR33_11155 [Propionibacteriaceae bacterium]|nr:hypothetical protein [Propionibacteriaceae bacterium]
MGFLTVFLIVGLSVAGLVWIDERDQWRRARPAVQEGVVRLPPELIQAFYAPAAEPAERRRGDAD